MSTGRWIIVLLLLGSLCNQPGCQRSEPVAQNPISTARNSGAGGESPTAIVARHEPEATSPAALAPAEIPADLGPEAVCERFLEFLARGEVSDAERLLSRRSATVTRQARLVLAAPAGDNTRFVIEPAQYSDLKQKRAMVLCRFVEEAAAEGGSAAATSGDTAGEGGPGGPGDAISWMLRRDNEGWRITGLVLLEHELPINLLSFENPSDVDAIRDLLGSPQPVLQAAGPGTVNRR